MSGGRAAAGSFLALQELARSFGEARSPAREQALCASAARLGATALPLCRRELSGRDPGRRAWASRLLETIAGASPALRARVVAALRDITDGAGPDDAKVAAVALLGDLGETAAGATFRDPVALHRRSLADLATLLTRRPDVARAADLLVSRLDGDALLELVDGLAQTAPTRTLHLVDELLVRTELDAALRGELIRVAAPLRLVRAEPLAPCPRGRARVVLLRHPGGRAVYVVARRDPDGGHRCLGLLVEDGKITDAIYREAADPRSIRDELIAPLVDDGFAPVLARAAAARDALAAAARRTVEAGDELPSAYFLGRDLLDLGNAHQPDAAPAPDLATSLLGRATDLLAAGEPERARPLFERGAELLPDDAAAAAGLGLCLLAAGDLGGARGQLERAARLEPTWPLHHWNLAAIAHRQGRLAACYLALRRFLAAADALPGAPHDPDHQARVATATAFIADHERWVRLEHPGADAVRLAEAAEAAEARAGRAAAPARRARSRGPGRRGAVSAHPRRSAPRPSPARP